MIRAIAWFCGEHCGVFVPQGESFTRPSPDLNAAAEILSLAGRPLKYYSRMTEETRACLCAASFALRGARWSDTGAREIGLLAAGAGGLVAANLEYFHDYCSNGRSLGRGNLFIYTLATSALGETAIALGLTGPCMFVEDDSAPFRSAARHGERMVCDGEADGMLIVSSQPGAAVCAAVDAASDEDAQLASIPDLSPAEFCGALFSMVKRA